MIDTKKEKLVNAIIYFVKNTKYCKKTKLFKLLYFLDFIHFKKYGTTVTGLEYYTWTYGPVPKKLFYEFSNNSDMFKNYFNIIKEDDEETGTPGFKIYLKQKQPDLSQFTPNEIKIIVEVSFTYKNAKASEISEVSHLKGMPWDRTKKEKGEDKLIDYELAIDEETELSREEIMERFNLEKELMNFT